MSMMRLRQAGSRAAGALTSPMLSMRMAPAPVRAWGGLQARMMSYDLSKMRNIGISAHIDSGKTTLTERILFYTGRIHAIHDVKGKDGVGAKMDSMDLEREKGITIQSAATFAKWGDIDINIIDTPGHVDFTIEVERALRVLDGAVLVLCGVAGVQSQSITVDRQMKRYKVPRVAFINKLDRMGANPWKPIQDMRDMLQLNAAAVQLPIGEEGDFKGIVDIVAEKAIIFEGDHGEILTEVPVPEALADLMAEKRAALIEALSNVDEEMEELFLMEETPTVEQIRGAIRRSTIANTFVPVFMGSAFKNKGVQPLLDGVREYLPDPTQVENIALDQDDNEAPVVLASDDKEELVALAFKLEENRFGQLTYMRVYQGTLKRRDFIQDVSAGTKKVAVPRLVRMHADDMEEIQEAKAGEIVAMFGIDCISGATFTSGAKKLTMTSMFVPNPVISLSIKPKDRATADKFSKALARFQREDPTFRVRTDDETNETIISGMGELHLEVYAERMNREYECPTILGRPEVAYRETLTKKVEFDYTHKKQTGGSGQYGRLLGYVEPMEEGESEQTFVFDNQLQGQAIDPSYHSAIAKGFEEAATKGPMSGNLVRNCRVVITEGMSHAVDSSEMAFRLTAVGAFREAFRKAQPQLLEPVMNVEVEAPSEFQANVVAGLNQRKGMIQTVDAQSGLYCKVNATVPLSQMFGYSTDLRSTTQGKGEFAMEFCNYQPTPRDEQERIMKEFAEAQAARNK